MTTDANENSMSRRKGPAMVTNRINGSENVSRDMMERFQENRTQPGKEILPEKSESIRDTADISLNAKRLNALHDAIESGLKAVESVPEVRQDRVAEVRSRLDRGFYHSVEVRYRIAERLGAMTDSPEDD